MANLFQGYDLESLDDKDPIERTLVDTTQTPDTILLDWLSLSCLEMSFDFDSRAFPLINFYQAIFYLNAEAGPQSLEQIDASQTPDTILLDWLSGSIPSEPFYESAAKLDPSVTPNAGGVFGYL